MLFVQLKDYKGMLYSFTDPSTTGTDEDVHVCDNPTQERMTADPVTGVAMCSEHTQFMLPVVAMVLIAVQHHGTPIFMAYDNVKA